MNIDIRAALESDVPRLEALPFSAGLRSKHRERLARQVAGQVKYILAVDEGWIIGHLILKWNCPEHPDLRRLIPSCAEIEDFVVAPDQRSGGVGSAMLEFAARECHKHRETRLGLAVGKENPHAWGLYERRGFVLVPESDHRVTWLARDLTGHEVEEFEDCVYLMKELA